MTPQEIIAADCERTGHRVGAVMHGVMKAMDKAGAQVLHDNKSVVILEPIEKSKKDFKVHLFTVDSPLGVVRSVQKIVAQIQQVPGLERVYGNAKDPQVIQMLRTAGVAVQKPDKKDYTWMAEA